MLGRSKLGSSPSEWIFFGFLRRRKRPERLIERLIEKMFEESKQDGCWFNSCYKRKSSMWVISFFFFSFFFFLQFSQILYFFFFFSFSFSFSFYFFFFFFTILLFLYDWLFLLFFLHNDFSPISILCMCGDARMFMNNSIRGSIKKF